MILSMTGYGKASVRYQDKKITCEVKSLNSKALDLSTRVTALYREKEMEVRSMVSTALERGKVECSLWYEKEGTEEAVTINGALMKTYLQQMQENEKLYGIPMPADLGASLIRMPEVMARKAEEELTDEEWSVACSAVKAALEQLTAFRTQEGSALEAKFRENISRISSLLESIEPYEKQRTEKIKQKLTDALASIPEVEYDHGRLEQEMIFYIEKLDINEEKQRLRNHLSYFIETLEGEKGQGKKLGFIAQEMGREINTTGSKSNQAEMQLIVVQMKDELEQIKEQVLNVL